MDKQSDLSQHTTPDNSSTSTFATKSSHSTDSCPTKKKRLKWLFVLVIALLALAISLLSGYTALKMRSDQQQLTLLQSNLSRLTQQLDKAQGNMRQSQQQVTDNASNNQQLSLQLKQQSAQQNELSSALQQLQNQLSQQTYQLKQLQQQQMNSSQLGAPQQRLLQAEQILQQATMQIWVYQAPSAAIPLLNKAEFILNSLHLSGLQPIIDDLNSELTALQQVNPNSLTENYHQLQQLITQVDQLSIASATATETKEPVSDSLNNWKTNLINSFKHFSQEFIQVTPRDPLAHCLQTATSNQQIQHCQLFRAISTTQQQQNLVNNLRNQLVIASQALIAHQPTLFESALSRASKWTQLYFDLKQPNTQQFLKQLQGLQQATLFPAVTFPLQSSQKLAALLDEQLAKTDHSLTPASEGR